MPYGGTSPTQDKKIEDCVNRIKGTNKRTGKPYTKSEKIAICKSSIMSQGGDMEKEVFSYPISNEDFTKGELLKDVEIFKTGDFRDHKYTEKDLDKIVNNFNDLKQNADFDPPVRIGHKIDDPQRDAEGLRGYVEKLKRVGKKLLADLDITEPDLLEKIKRGTLRKRSVELGPYEDNSGKEYGLTLWGLGFVDIPQVEGLLEVAVHSKTLKQKGRDNINEDKEKSMAKAKKDEVKFEKKEIADDEEVKEDEKVEEKSEDEPEEKVEEKAKEKIEEEKEEKEEDKKDIEVEGKDEKEKGTEEDVEEVAKENDEENKDEEDEEDKEDEEPEKEEAADEFSKKVAELSKTEMSKVIKEKEDTIQKLSKKIESFELRGREMIIEDFAKEGKSMPAILDKEKDFIKSLTDEQFDKYVDLKKSQPKIVALNAKLGTQESIEPKKKAETAEARVEEAAKKAEKLTEPFRKAAEERDKKLNPFKK